jgi:hypothetical protein
MGRRGRPRARLLPPLVPLVPLLAWRLLARLSPLARLEPLSAWRPPARLLPLLVQLVPS